MMISLLFVPDGAGLIRGQSIRSFVKIKPKKLSNPTTVIARGIEKFWR